MYCDEQLCSYEHVVPRNLPEVQTPMVVKKTYSLLKENACFLKIEIFALSTPDMHETKRQ